MTAIHISQFGGIIPQMASRLLPDSNAQVASNVKLQSGELRPLYEPRTALTPNKPLPVISMYLARNGEDLGFFTWPYDVDVVRSPLPSDVESRFYWTGDGEPRYGKYSDTISGSSDDYPKNYFALGIPAPTIKPTISVTGGISMTTVTRFYVYTFFSALGEESAPSPVSDTINGLIDAMFVVSNMSAFPSNSGSGSATYSSGVTTFTNSGSALHWLRVGDHVTINGSDVVVVSIPTAYSFTVGGNYATATAWARVAPWNTSGMKRRLYRTTGTQGAFQLVNDDVGTSYTDTLTDAQIMGDELISTGWFPPPANLSGIIVHSSGALVGFAGNQLYFSEPYQPHAWLKKYQLATDYNIVGIATYGSEIGVTTAGNPYVASGVDPASMTMQKVNGMYPCLSKRSVISVGDGVLYASTHGLIYVGNSGVSVFTQQFFTKDDWAPHNPSAMICEFAYGRVYVSTTGLNNLKYMMIFDGSILVTVDVHAHELYTDTATGTLYIGTDSNVSEWDAGDKPLLGSWKSKKYMFPTPLNFGAAKIEFDNAIDPDYQAAILAIINANTAENAAMIATTNLHGSYNSTAYNTIKVGGSKLKDIPPLPASNVVSFTLFSKNVPVFSRTVYDDKAFRLPAGFKTDEVDIQINSQSTINEIRLAETMSGLKAV